MRTIRHYIDRRAEEQPDKIYLIAPEPRLTLTYRQLKEDSAELGKHLLSKGLNKGDKVSFMLGNGYQTTKIFLGAMYSGFVIAPLNSAGPAFSARICAGALGLQMVFFTADQQEKLKRPANPFPKSGTHPNR
jgi:acyl-CoA synthetase (AMP-forming)/AMP-acid ligase II